MGDPDSLKPKCGVISERRMMLCLIKLVRGGGGPWGGCFGSCHEGVSRLFESGLRELLLFKRGRDFPISFERERQKQSELTGPTRCLKTEQVRKGPTRAGFLALARYVVSE